MGWYESIWSFPRRLTEYAHARNEEMIERMEEVFIYISNLVRLQLFQAVKLSLFGDEKEEEEEENKAAAKAKAAAAAAASAAARRAEFEKKEQEKKEDEEERKYVIIVGL